jgi:alpha-galactosidase
MKKKQPQPSTTLVYIVQDYNQGLVGVHTTLAKAATQYEQVLAEGLTEEDHQALIEEYGEDFHNELEYPACIVVYELDANWLYSYDSMTEVQQALLNGERYD